MVFSKPAEVSVTLHGGEPRGDLVAYPPGGTVRGTVTVTPTRDVEVKDIQIALMFRTRGRGTTDSERADTLSGLFSGAVSRDMPASYEFTLTLPDAPWSYDGQLIEIEWNVEVFFDARGLIDARHHQPFIVAPDAQADEAEESIW